MVCTGNICRSPTAEGVLRDKARAAGVSIEVDSCGTHDYHIGEPPDRRSQAHARRRGYDLSAQRARQFEARDYARFDLIFAMDSRNLAQLQARCPAEHRHKLQRLLAYSTLDRDGDVPDPYYDGDAGFERVLDLIEDAADQLLHRLKTSDEMPRSSLS